VAQDGTASPVEQGLSEILYDANRFLLSHRVMVEGTPLQLYASALVFSPEQSVVRNQFSHDAPEWVAVMPGVDATWDTCLQTLFGHQSSVKAVAYSPDGHWLVSGSDDGVVKLWHVDSGTS
jgi:WD40 repeat protein